MPIESKPADDKKAEKAPPLAPVIGTTGIVADKNYYLAKDGSVADHLDSKGGTLLAARGSMITPETIALYGLKAEGGGVVQIKAGEEGAVAPAAAVNEGQLREPGEPLILAPRTGVLRGEMAERTIYVEGDEVDLQATKTIAVSNVPPEDDEFRARVAEETKDESAAADAEKEAAASKRKTAAKTPARRPRKGK